MVLNQMMKMIAFTAMLWCSVIFLSFGQVNPNIPKTKMPPPKTQSPIETIKEHRQNLGTRSRFNDAIIELNLQGHLFGQYFENRTEILGVINGNEIVFLKDGRKIGQLDLYDSERSEKKFYSAGIPLADVVHAVDKSFSHEPILLFDQNGGYEVYEINRFDGENGWFTNPAWENNGKSENLFPDIFQQVDAAIIDIRLSEVYVFYKNEYIKYRYNSPYLSFRKVEGPSSIYSKFNFRVDRLESAFMQNDCFYFFTQDQYWRICKDSLENSSRVKTRSFPSKRIDGDFQLGGHNGPQ